MLETGNFHQHRRIRDFRARHLLELSDLFVHVVKLAREMALVKLGTVAIDGTKIRANANRNMTRACGGFDSSFNGQTATRKKAIWALSTTP